MEACSTTDREGPSVEARGGCACSGKSPTTPLHRPLRAPGVPGAGWEVGLQGRWGRWGRALPRTLGTEPALMSCIPCDISGLLSRTPSSCSPGAWPQPGARVGLHSACTVPFPGPRPLRPEGSPPAREADAGPLGRCPTVSAGPPRPPVPPEVTQLQASSLGSSVTEGQGPSSQGTAWELAAGIWGDGALCLAGGDV